MMMTNAPTDISLHRATGGRVRSNADGPARTAPGLPVGQTRARCHPLVGTAHPTRRGGAALIVVMALLGTLAFLGLLFYAFAAQELASAQNFATAPPPTYPPTMYEDFALEQLLRGTRPSLADSALYGSNWAIIPNMIGRPNFDEKLSLSNPNNAAGNRFADVNPFDGLGIGVWADASNQGALGNGEFIFDYTGEGAPDADETDFRLNFSRPANPGPDPWIPPIETFAFHPDAGYTYPDVNSLFLAFDGFVRDPNNPNNVYRVIIPSFHRPQYFPFKRFAQGAPNPAGFGDIFIDPNTVDKVLRPHANHIAGVASVDIPPYYNAGDPIPRFYGAVGGIQAQSGDTTRTIPPFAFLININSNPNDVDSNGAPVINQAGVWSIADVPVDPNRPGSQFPTSTVYEFDVDNDGDGFRDSIWMDLDHPILDLPDGRQFVPLFAFKVIDADGLLNVNAHGNMNGFVPRNWYGDALGRGDLSSDLVSVSNLGLSRSEINLGLGLDAPPVNVPLGQHEASFGAEPGTIQELSNTELLMLLNGRENWRIDPGVGLVMDSRIEGRWGEHQIIEDFYVWVRNPNAGLAGAPAPGAYRLDDDGDSNMIGYAQIFGASNPPGIITPTFPPSFFADDDINAPVGHPRGGSAYRDRDLGNVWVPPFVHPLDYAGIGWESYLQDTGSHFSRVFKTAAGDLSLMHNPLRWLSYAGSPARAWQYQFVAENPDASLAGDAYVNTHPIFGVLPYRQAVTSGALQLDNRLHDFLRDEGDEVILDRRAADPDYDAIFGTSEMDGLHLSGPDYAAVGAPSRLRQLAIVNLDKTNEATRRRIAGRFTTDSWDRLDFGNGHSVNATEDRQWELTHWNGNTAEFQTTTGNPAFPPEFGSAGSKIAAGPHATPGMGDDPFRPELRLLLKSELGYNVHLNENANAQRFPRHRLNINRILSDESYVDFPDVTNLPDLGQLAAFDTENNPRFRNLTPHPNLRALDEIDTTSSIPAESIMIPAMEHRNLPFGTAPSGPPFADLSIDPNTASEMQRADLARAMEWWARYDRQRLARDIYVLLWVLGGGQDVQDYTAVNTPPLYTDAQVKEMAQFAVNLVDAMDRDNVITHFEYDPNLTDGWDTTGASLEEVDGVEAQQLTFSEALWIRSPEITTGNGPENDHDATLYDDRANTNTPYADDHHYLFIELRSGSPFPVEFNNDAWRIRVVGLPSSTILDNTITPQRGTLATPMIVQAGENFLIGTHDGESHVMGGPNDNKVRASTFRVDYDDDLTYEAIVPYRNDPTPPTGTTVSQARDDYPDPLVDLDVCHERDRLTERFAEHSETPGYFIDLATFADAEMVLALERRHNLHGEGLIDYSADDWGEWIEVDRITVDRRDFALQHDDEAMDIYNTTSGDGRLKPLRSQERPEPFFADDTLFNSLSEAKGLRQYADTGTNPLYRHTLGSPDPAHVGTDPSTQPPPDPDRDDQKNSQSLGGAGDVFTLWQPHFDRDFSSVYELLSVPLYGAQELIYRNRQSGEVEGGLSEKNIFKLSDRNVAGIRFQHPFADSDFDGMRDLDANGDDVADAMDDNRWYRLLEFLTTEDGGEQPLRERLENLVRTPGKMNLNTIRDESVLAAILDDPHIKRFGATELPFITEDEFDENTNPPGAPPSAHRNWYREFILARDGIDPLNAFNAGVALPLPGVPGVPSDPVGGTVQFGAVPYRSLSYVAPSLGGVWPDSANLNKTAHSLLRHHVADDPMTLGLRATGLEQLGLFEARPSTDVGTDAVDFHTRNRLLAKVANHTTTRSNVFEVWLTVGFFEAHQPDPSNPNVVQIGGEMAGMARHRAFFVVDRTRLEDAVQVDNRGTPETDDDIMTLDWRTFLLHRRTLPGR